MKISKDIHKPDPARTETPAKQGPNVRLYVMQLASGYGCII